MAQFPGLSLTVQGNRMILRSSTGKVSDRLIVTKAVIGDGQLTTSIDGLTEIISKKLEIGLTEVKDISNGQMRLQFNFDNRTLENGFYWREVGLYAKNGDDGEEKLIGYSNAKGLTSYIPDKNNTIPMQRLVIALGVGDNPNVAGKVDLSSSITIEQLESYIKKHNDDTNAHNITTQISNAMSKLMGGDFKIIFPLYDKDTSELLGSDTSGDCIIFGSANKWMMVDTFCYEKNASKIIECCRENNVTEIETLLITHYHSDHFGNIEYILKNLKVKKVLVPVDTALYFPTGVKYSYNPNGYQTIIDACNKYKVPYEILESNRDFSFGDVSDPVIVNLINCNAEDREWAKSIPDYNEGSIVTKVKYRDSNIVLLSDLSIYGQSRLYDLGYFNETIDLLKVGHHSVTQISENMVGVLNPKYAVIPLSWDLYKAQDVCRFNTISTLSKYGTKNYITSEQSKHILFAYSKQKLLPISGLKAVSSRALGQYNIDVWVNKTAGFKSEATGSKDKPFSSVFDAMAWIYRHLDVGQGFVMHVAAGDYTTDMDLTNSRNLRLNLFGLQGMEIKIVGAGKESTFLPPVFILNCNRVAINDVTISKLANADSYKEVIRIDSGSYVWIGNVNIATDVTSINTVYAINNSTVKLSNTTHSNTEASISGRSNSTIIVEGNTSIDATRVAFNGDNSVVIITGNSSSDIINYASTPKIASSDVMTRINPGVIKIESSKWKGVREYGDGFVEAWGIASFNNNNNKTTVNLPIPMKIISASIQDIEWDENSTSVSSKNFAVVGNGSNTTTLVIVATGNVNKDDVLWYVSGIKE